MKCNISVLIFVLTGCSGGGGAFSGSGITDLPGDAGTGSGGNTATGGTTHSSGGALDGGASAGGTTNVLGSGGTTSGGGATATGGATSAGGAASGGSPGSGGSSSTCSSGAARCSSTIPTLRETCVAGAWVADSFLCSGGTPVCLNGACVACDPGAKSCASATQPRTCDASGAWAPDTACPAATPLCSDGACSAVCCKLPIGSAINPVSCSSGNAWTCVVPWQGGGGSNYSCTEQGRCTSGLTCGYASGPFAGTTGTVEACP
jgi:hypothetical protein